MSKVGCEVIANEAITEKERKMLRTWATVIVMKAITWADERDGNNRGWVRSFGDKNTSGLKIAPARRKGNRVSPVSNCVPSATYRNVMRTKNLWGVVGESVSRAMMTTDWHLWNTNVRTQSSRDRWVGQRSLDHTRYPLQQVRGIVRIGENTRYATMCVLPTSHHELKWSKSTKKWNLGGSWPVKKSICISRKKAQDTYRVWPIDVSRGDLGIVCYRFRIICM